MRGLLLTFIFAENQIKGVMKKVGLLFVAALVATVIVGKVSSQEGVTNELLMSNIEALAAGEGEWHYAYCLGSGNVKCPDGTYVEYVIGKCSID